MGKHITLKFDMAKRELFLRIDIQYHFEPSMESEKEMTTVYMAIS